MDLTGHLKVDTLRNYDPVPDNNVKIQRAFAILGSKKKASATITSGEAQEISTVAQVHNVDPTSRISTISTTYRDQK